MTTIGDFKLFLKSNKFLPGKEKAFMRRLFLS